MFVGTLVVLSAMSCGFVFVEDVRRWVALVGGWRGPRGRVEGATSSVNARGGRVGAAVMLLMPLEPIARANICPDPVPLLGTLEFGSGREGAGACRILTLAR